MSIWYLAILLGVTAVSVAFAIIIHEGSPFVVVSTWTDDRSVSVYPPRMERFAPEEISDWGMRVTAIAAQLYSVIMGIPLIVTLTEPYGPLELALIAGSVGAAISVSPSDLLALAFPARFEREASASFGHRKAPGFLVDERHQRFRPSQG